MEAETGCPTSTTVLKINAAMSEIGAGRIGLVTPYTSDVADQIAHVYRGLGFDVAAVTAHGGDMSRDFASISEAEIEEMVRIAVAPGVDAAIIMCTNLAGANTAARLGAVMDIPILDSAALTLAE